MNGNYFAGIRRTESNTLFTRATVLENSHEHGFTDQHALSGTDERIEEARSLLRAIPKNGLHLDAILHVHHAARFGDGCFHRVELDFDELHVIAENFVINFVHASHRRTAWAIRWGG